MHDGRNRAALPLLLALLLLPCGALVAQEGSVSQRAQALMTEGRYAEARPILEKELRENDLLSDNDRENMLFQLAYSLLELKEYRPSISTWHEFITFVPEHPMIWGNLGWTYYLNGDLDSAIIATDRALKTDATMAAGWGNMGLYRLAKGDIEGMQKAYAEVPKYAKDVDTWKAIRKDYTDYCSDPSREGCEKAGEALEKAWLNLLLRWYMESESAKGTELVGSYTEEYRLIQERLSTKVETMEGAERDQLAALLERLGKDLK